MGWVGAVQNSLVPRRASRMGWGQMSCELRAWLLSYASCFHWICFLTGLSFAVVLCLYFEFDNGNGQELDMYGFESGETSVSRIQKIGTSEMEDLAYFTIKWPFKNISFVRRFSSVCFCSRMGWDGIRGCLKDTPSRIPRCRKYNCPSISNSRFIGYNWSIFYHPRGIYEIEKRL